MQKLKNFVDLFRNPPAKYRGAPFWAWNCRLDADIVRENIACFDAMGFGGFHIHSRTGMDMPYLRKEFMDLVRLSVDEAQKRGMLTYLYDEDRWPSGAAGGYVTRDKRYRERKVLFTPEHHTDDLPQPEAVEQGAPYFLAAYRVTLNADGTLAHYASVSRDSTGDDVWYAFCVAGEESPWYNNQAYLDVLSPDAVDRFIEVTYDAYADAVGEHFGDLVPSIFTDEPHPAFRCQLSRAAAREAVEFPWTPDFPDTYAAAYSVSPLEILPEIVWDLPDGGISAHRLNYHNHITDRFVNAFVRRCGAWCDAHGLGLTGHVLGEDSLFMQTEAVGDVMRCYPHFTLPGMDLLCDMVHLNTAKQVASVSRQKGAGGVMSELYGVTNWDFDFRGHKFQGDWQAALGVTLRVPHLSWTSMQGEAKRDYPASIGHQSPWYKEYRLLEDHYARLSVALTQGKEQVSVAVVHPIESYFCRFGPKDTSQSALIEKEIVFRDLTAWLLRGQVDFDFLCEANLPPIATVKDGKLTVGQMTYDTVLVPACETIRRTTLDLLRDFSAQGGRVLFVGEPPRYVDGLPSDEPTTLCAAERVEYTADAVRAALQDKRYAQVTESDGTLCDAYIGQYRRDGDEDWLFLAPCEHPDCDNTPAARRTIEVDGEWRVTLFDTFTGERRELPATYHNGSTYVVLTVYPQDSLLLRLQHGKSAVSAQPETVARPLPWSLTKITRAEPNVLLLDRAAWALDDEPLNPCEEILRLDNIVRERLEYPLRTNKWAQPWTTPVEPTEHTIILQYTISSECMLEGVHLALECPEECTVTLNGVAVSTATDGYFVDRSIKTITLPPMVQGENVLTLRYLYGRRSGLEAVYLLGEFAVALDGSAVSLQPPHPITAFGSITQQGAPFYGGNLTYHLVVDVPEDSATLQVSVPDYCGALVGVSLDGERRGKIITAPYACTLTDVSAGTHTVSLTLFGNRFNTFGALHNCDPDTDWFGPMYWRSTGENWTYDYLVRPVGILTSPMVELRTMEE